MSRCCGKMMPKTCLGISLVVQWLRICLPKQGTWVWSLVRELRSHKPQPEKPAGHNKDPARPKKKKKKKILAWCRVATNLQSVKCAISVRCDKGSYACVDSILTQVLDSLLRSAWALSGAPLSGGGYKVHYGDPPPSASTQPPSAKGSCSTWGHAPLQEWPTSDG